MVEGLGDQVDFGEDLVFDVKHPRKRSSPVEIVELIQELGARFDVLEDNSEDLERWKPQPAVTRRA